MASALKEGPNVMFTSVVEKAHMLSMDKIVQFQKTFTTNTIYRNRYHGPYKGRHHEAGDKIR